MMHFSIDILLLLRCFTASLLILCLNSCIYDGEGLCPEDYEPDGENCFVHLSLVMPINDWNTYLSRSMMDNLLCIVELYNVATGNRTMHSIIMGVKGNYGTYQLDISAKKGTYKLLVWAVAPENGQLGLYVTENLKEVHLSEECLSNLSFYNWEKRIALCSNMQIEVSDYECYMDVNMWRPFAHYQLYVIDQEQYLSLREQNDWPPLAQLGAKIFYQGFYPTGINVASGNPNDALAGIQYELETQWDTEKEVLVGEDIILTGNSESFLQMNIILYDKDTGATISQASNIIIPYLQGHTTEIRGKWLCSNESQGGVGIDPSWEEVIVPF